MQKLDMDSKNLVQTNIDKLIDFLSENFPSSVNEWWINFDALKQELSDEVIDWNKEKYQLTWPGKKEAIATANERCNKTLRPVREESVDFDNTKNIYIEWDNLETLKILQQSYLNKIDCIYIDPPYNTGKDFVYDDNFYKKAEQELIDSWIKDKEWNILISELINTNSNWKFHSAWLSMMYSRLKLARNLLKDDWIIFISIDDNEYDNLKKICDEIFWEFNRVASFIWKKRYQWAKERHIVIVHEYILMYCKNIDYLPALFIPSDEEYAQKYFKNKDEYFDVRWPFRTQPLEAWKSMWDRDNLRFWIKAPDWTIVNPKRQWIWSQDHVNEAIESWHIGFSKNNNGTWNVFIKQYLKDENGEQRDTKMFSLIDNVFTQNGTKEIQDYFSNGNIFNFPKPTALLIDIFQLLNYREEAIFLDFFSWSASTADSIMQLNAWKNNNRKYILVQLPEVCEENSEAYKAWYKNICEIWKERIRRAWKKIKAKTNADIDYWFRVYKVDSSNMKDVFYKPWDLDQDSLFDSVSNIKEDRSWEDILTQVILDLWLPLDLKIEEKKIQNQNIFFVEENYLIACFDDKVDLNVVEEIAKYEPKKVVFKDGSFKSDQDKINLQEKFKRFSPSTEINIL